MKREAICSNDPRMQFMLAVVASTGRPEIYANDVYQHDLSTLRANPNISFLWILRQCGTELIELHDRLNSTDRYYCRSKIEWWSGFHETNWIDDPADHPYYFIVCNKSITRVSLQDALRLYK
jgi:hypothetical protein